MKKTDTEQIRIANRKKIIEYLRVHGPIARVDMGQALKLSPATVTAITAELSRDGRLIETPVEVDKNASRGRPRVAIDLSPRAVTVLAIKLSINELRLMLGDQKGNIIHSTFTELKTLELDEAGLINTICSEVNALRNQLSQDEQPKAIGIAVQGVVNGLKGEIVWSPALANKHIPLQAPLEKAFNLPVTVANDANALAIAIRHQPDYQQLKNFAVIMLGNGIGMGMFIGGELYLGHFGAAAEFGHTKYSSDGAQCLCGKQGCIEAYIGDYALYREASKILTLPQDDLLHPTEEGMMKLVALADQQHKEICQLYDRAGQILGYGLANLIALSSPEKIIISGPGVRAYHHLEHGMQAGLENSLIKELIAQTSIESVDWHEDMTVLGVIALALQTID